MAEEVILLKDRTEILVVTEDWQVYVTNPHSATVDGRAKLSVLFELLESRFGTIEAAIAALAEADAGFLEGPLALDDIPDLSSLYAPAGAGGFPSGTPDLIDFADSPFTAGANTQIIADCSGGAVAVALPVGVVNAAYFIKKSDTSANFLTITPNGAETINGDATLVIEEQHTSVMLVFDGVGNWNIF